MDKKSSINLAIRHGLAMGDNNFREMDDRVVAVISALDAAGFNIVWKSRPPEREMPQVQTIEKTGKFYKGIKLIGFLMIIGAIPISCAGKNEHLALVLVVVGIVIVIVAKISAWWSHG